MICPDCRNKKQISQEDFNKLPYRLSRQLDCKNLSEDGKSQCSRYSIENAHSDCIEEIKGIISGKIKNKDNPLKEW